MISLCAALLIAGSVAPASAADAAGPQVTQTYASFKTYVNGANLGADLKSFFLSLAAGNAQGLGCEQSGDTFTCAGARSGAASQFAYNVTNNYEPTVHASALRFAGQTVAAYYAAQLKTLAPQLKALGGNEYYVQPQIDRLNSEAQGEMNLMLLQTGLQKDWMQVIGSLADAQKNKAANDKLIADFNKKAAGVKSSLQFATRMVWSDTVSGFRKSLTTLAKARNCHDRCDQKWQAALAAASTALDALGVQITGATNTTGTFLSSCEKLGETLSNPKLTPSQKTDFTKQLAQIRNGTTAFSLDDEKKKLTALQHDVYYAIDHPAQRAE